MLIFSIIKKYLKVQHVFFVSQLFLIAIFILYPCRSIAENLVADPSGENGLEGWRPREGISLATTASEGVNISGEQTGRRNYCSVELSDSVLVPDAIYRLEAWMRVETISSPVAPTIKVAAKNIIDGSITNYFSRPYSTGRAHENCRWQRLLGRNSNLINHLFSIDP